VSKGNLLDALIVATTATMLLVPGTDILFTVIIAASYAKSRLARTGALEHQTAGQTLNVISNEASLPVIYGQAKVGPILADVEHDLARPTTFAVTIP